MSWWRGLGVATLLVGLFPPTALAHPLVDRGVASYENGDLDEALGAFAQAEASTELSRAELLVLLLHRALVYFALGESSHVDADLLRLASLEPGFALPRTLPPQVRDAFERVSRSAPRPLSATVSQERTGETVRLRVDVRDDVAGLVNRIRVRARVGGGVWRAADDRILDVEAPLGSSCEYFAELVGPGGAVVAVVGSADAPVSLDERPSEGGERPNGSTGVPAAALEGNSPNRLPDRTWLWIGIGGYVVVAAAATVAVLFFQPEPQTELSAPVLFP